MEIVTKGEVGVPIPVSNKILQCLFICERQSMSRGGAERQGDTESEAGFRLCADSTEPDAGLELMNCEIMT